MKLLKIYLIVLFLSLSTFAHAKVTYKNKLMHDDHVLVIKGFLYDIVNARGPEVRLQIGPGFAGAIVWLEKLHKSKKMYKIMEDKSDNAALIIASIKYIADIAKGEDKDIPPIALDHWYERGKNVIAEYREYYKNKKLKVHWKLELKKKDPSGRVLLD